jgi:hypothetical protein
MSELTGYDLSRNFFDFCFENPELISPNHSAIYFFAIEHCNRLGWKRKYGFPTQMAMDAIGIKKHSTYIRYFNDLVEWGFFELVQKSQNQYSSNIISLTSAMPKNGKALGKAIGKHRAKQTETNGQSTGQTKRSIDKLKEPLTNKQPTWFIFRDYAVEHKPTVNIKSLHLKYQSWEANGWKDGHDKPIKNWKSKLLNTLPYIDEATARPADEYAAHMASLLRA